MMGTISSPAVTARGPPGIKSFCISTINRQSCLVVVFIWGISGVVFPVFAQLYFLRVWVVGKGCVTMICCLGMPQHFSSYLLSDVTHKHIKPDIYGR